MNGLTKFKWLVTNPDRDFRVLLHEHYMTAKSKTLIIINNRVQILRVWHLETYLSGSFTY